jgi:2-oxoglutarate ferredoxin oxidoreductase subunit delta
MPMDKTKYFRMPYDWDSVKVAKGIVHIIKDRCKGCGFCVEYCPKDVLEISEEFNTKGYHPPLVRNADDCVNCGLCEMLCPEFAIWSTLKEKLDTPIS